MNPENIIQLCFDLDDTLCSNTTTLFLQSKNIDPKGFYEKSDDMVRLGYNPTSAYLWLLIETLPNVTSQDFINFGKTVKMYNGVHTLKTRLQELFPNYKIEMHLISAGIPEVIKGLKVYNQFDSVWTNTLIYNKNDNPIRVASSITPSEKIGCLNAIQKRLKSVFGVNTLKFKVPHQNILYIGDGLTDISALTYNKAMGGYSIAVDPKDTWKNSFINDKRVNGIYSADYGINSDLFKAIRHYISNLN